MGFYCAFVGVGIFGKPCIKAGAGAFKKNFSPKPTPNKRMRGEFFPCLRPAATDGQPWECGLMTINDAWNDA
jgi:hypothetical protein